MCTKLILLKNPPFILREPAMWMSTTPTKERLPAIRGTAQGRHTDLGCAPLFWHKAPGSLSQATNHQEFVSPVLALVESFPGAMSPLGSKESHEPTHCQTLHPSYKSQHDRNSLKHFEPPSVHPELVEGFRESFSATCSMVCHRHHSAPVRECALCFAGCRVADGVGKNSYGRQERGHGRRWHSGQQRIENGNWHEVQRKVWYCHRADVGPRTGKRNADYHRIQRGCSLFRYTRGRRSRAAFHGRRRSCR